MIVADRKYCWTHHGETNVTRLAKDGGGDGAEHAATMATTALMAESASQPDVRQQTRVHGVDQQTIGG